ncbi:MAG: hypothetical protein NC911_05485 [Candidatus Omnitrophica bacterium]|nr:hypothetical protein [Candidatus Omnitrophota bacterium]
MRLRNRTEKGAGSINSSLVTMQSDPGSIAILKPHFMPTEQLLPLLSNLRKRYPPSRIFITASPNHSSENELSLHKSNFSSPQLVIFPEWSASFFKYTYQLRKQKCDLGIIPIYPSAYHFPTFYRKIILAAFMSGIRNIRTYNIETGDYKLLRRREIINSLMLIDLLVLTVAVIAFPLTVVFVLTFVFGRLQVISNKSSLPQNS